jgi:hypothetical protein
MIFCFASSAIKIPCSAVALELNSVEGIHGGADRQIVPEQRGPATPTQ